MQNIEGKIEPIGKLFSSDFFFTIPDYQRPFAWEESNFQDLVDDLEEARSGQQYFLGTLVLHKRGGKNNYDIVDGQQRITSLLILLACLRDMIDDPAYKKSLQEKIVQEENKVDGIPELPRVISKDRVIFRELVLEQNGTLRKKKEEDLAEPETRYLQAISIFRKTLAKHNQTELEKFVQFINQHCNIIYIATTTFNDAFKLFTIVNDRGRQLRRIDVLKAQNISPDAIPSQITRDHVAKVWETLENEIGETEFESILYSMRMIIIKEKPQEDLLNEFDNKIFNKGLLQRGEKFVDEVKTYGDLYRGIFSDKDYVPSTDANHIKFKSMIHIMDKEFEASEWRACLMFFARKFEGASFYEFMLALEKKYLEQWVSGVRKDERFGTYSKILKSIDTSTNPADVIADMTYNAEVIKKAAEDPNLYNSRYAKYFLLRLEIINSEHDVYKEINAKSIEHVFPQNPNAASNWVKDVNFAEHRSVVNSIGNLVLLSKSKNSSASNHDFAVKKAKYLKDRISDYPRSLKVVNEADWTIAMIKMNTKDFAESILTDP